MKSVSDGMFESSYTDLYDGARHSTARLRQLLLVVQDNTDHALWPLAIVNATTCLEWFARSVLQQLIDFAPEQINPEARILRDLKINYALILQARSTYLSVGAIVAMSRNFSSFDEIDVTLTDLMNNRKPSALARMATPLYDLTTLAFRRGQRTKTVLAKQLNEMFKRRHELIHGSPRHLAFENELETQFSKRELLAFIHCAIQYIKQMDAALRRSAPQLAERTTIDINWNLRRKLDNSEVEVERIAKAIERRIAGDPDELREFRQTQRVWRLWRDKESIFQSGSWRGGTGRTAVILSYRTSFNLERLRSLEAYIRELDGAAPMRI
ncbi:DUF1311 domain-containing protein [Bradyrhizobium sp. 190]|uniref:lysozyme inhibitor LprI family protein n=1 Tax=Bradyrhizobium sp. 190 TaxID=2782658 RepID=UPI001FF968DC|nr:lysozyme inhibitor LprI family protein [Bradyrhizobium sp. 190]MCK1517450.1 DUF1311 domain-containing protein [Bradyrhizobium sp. 190]